MLAFVTVGCSPVEEEPQRQVVVDVNAAAAQGQSDIDNYATGRAVVIERHAHRSGAEQEAADVIVRYGRLLDKARYGEAWRVWDGDGTASGVAERNFARRFGRFAHVSLYVDRAGATLRDGRAIVPVVIYATLSSGQRVVRTGKVTLRRAELAPVLVGAHATGLGRGWRIVTTTR